jgi:hypothetical protein
MNQHPLPPSSIDAEFSDQELLAGTLTAAMLQGQVDEQDALPPALAERVIATGEAVVRAEAVPPVAPVAVERSPRTRDRRPAWGAWGGWLAAAAMLALVVRNGAAPRVEQAPVNTATAATTATTAIDARVALLDSLLNTPGVVRQRWTPTTDSTAATAAGEVIWDPATQRGVMRFTGLAANDREAWQYQLWIFDAERDKRYPVDGGVFDIPAGTGEVLVPIRARLAVGSASLFAVTVEPPGGVVVSSRERIAVTAQL